MTKARDLANGGFGLVLIKPSTVVGGTDNGKGTVSFSAASSVSLNDVFNSTYTNYKIVLQLDSSATTEINMRLRVGGSDASGASYSRAAYLIRNTGTLATYFCSGGGTSWVVTTNYAAEDASSVAVDLFEPFLAKKTRLVGLAHAADGTSYFGVWNASSYQASTSFTGFSFFPGTGNITGTVSVYGYNK